MRHTAITTTSALPRRSRHAGWLLLLLFVFTLLGNTITLAATETTTSEAQTDSQIDEQQVRDLLVKILSTTENNTSSTTEPEDYTPDYSGYEASNYRQWQGESMTHSLASRLHQLKDQLPNFSSELNAALDQATNPEAGFHWNKVVFTIALACVLGLLVEYLTTRKLLQRLHHYVDSREKTRSLKFKYILLRSVVQLLGIMALFVVAYTCELMNLYGNPYYDHLHTVVLEALIWFRISAIVCSNVFSPHHKVLRVVSLDCAASAKIYRWFLVFIFANTFGRALIDYCMFSDMEPILATGLMIPYSFLLNGLLISGVFVFKKEIDQMFLEGESGSSHSEVVKRQGFALQVFIHIWPAVFTAWLLGVWGSWLYNSFMGNTETAATIAIAWWITLIFPILDRLVHALLQNVSQIEWLQSSHFERRAAFFRRVMQTAFRLVSVVFALVAAFYAWGFNTGGLVSMAMGTEKLWRIVDILVTVGLVYTAWTLMSAYIERKLPVEESALASLEGDAGGAGASRSETLLPLIRSTLNVFFFVFLVLSVLHSTGISIAPILAGAGVVGIAVGFGAQKLVQDILSGMFFLIDDAFRRGEYIEIENLRGTVEQISLRSMQLRHHLGAVQTIPYGEIKTVRNLSRDWVTMKLELRLPYETDIEKVRKIIKKTGQKMLENDEMGPSFILPLKSQGVMRVDDSALIVRMKFTSKPGEQWIIRREAYRLVRDALEAEGIRFARREVRVLLPENTSTEAAADNTGNNSPLLTAAGAAAMTVLAAEAAAKAKLDEAGDDAGGGGLLD